MNRRTLWTSLALSTALAIFITGCKKNPPATAPQQTPPPSAPAPESTTAPTPRAPEAPPQPVKSEDVMSMDIQRLNTMGYLKDAFFDFDKADLRDDARTALASDADWMKKYPSIQVLVEGHCDERGTEEYNLSLGQKRASAVREYLTSLGVDGAHVKTVSYGKDRPFCSDHDETCWQQNRRGHFVITSK